MTSWTYLFRVVARSLRVLQGSNRLEQRNIFWRGLQTNTRSRMAEQQPFEKMEEQGVPKCPEATKVAAPAKEAQDLPKLSPQEFRAYNHMSEHMDMFVRAPFSPSLTFTNMTCSLSPARKLPPHLEHAVQRREQQQTAAGNVDSAVPVFDP